MRSSRPAREELDRSFAGYVIGILGPVAVAAALVAVRDDIEHTTSVLILVVVVVLAAMAGGRGAGAVAAIVAAASFGFFLTQPYLSLHIDSEADIETTIMLLVIGLLVGQIIVFARRDRRAAEDASAEIARLRRVAERAASGLATDELAGVVERELVELLNLRTCTFDRRASDIDLPVLERSGTLSVRDHRYDGRGFTLPAQGVELPVVAGGEVVGRFVLIPDVLNERGVPLDARIVAIALADQFGAHLAAADRAR